MTLITDLLEYGHAVFVEARQKVFTLFDLLGIILFIFPELAYSLTEDTGLIRTVAGVMFALSFFAANFVVYRKLTDQLSFEADIRLQVLEQSFDHSYGSRKSFPELDNPHGYNSVGMPDWASLWARIEIANVGHESGRLVWEIDKSRTRLPAVFALEGAKAEFFPAENVPARQTRISDLYFDIPFAERDPEAFARSLQSLIGSRRNYQVTLSYRTKRVSSMSKARRLVLEGDFNEFHEMVCRHWEDYGFGNLAQTAGRN
jgi:hypothetical protein